MATTRLGASGCPRSPYGSFAGKSTAIGRTIGTVTRLGCSGVPRQLYGSFAGKSTATGGRTIGTITRLGAHGGPRQLYGSFTGKELSVTIEAKTQFGKKFYEIRNKESSRKRKLSAKIFSLRQDEEDLMIILEIIKRLL